MAAMTEMIAPVAAWHNDHVGFGLLLDLLEREVAVFHEGGQPDYDLMNDIIYYLRNYSDRFHHPREDVAFDRLVERAPEVKMPVSRLQQEHRVIATAGEELLKRLKEAAEDVIMTRAAMEAAAATYLVYYRHHIATEEQEIMPLAARFLTKDDWAAVAAAVPAETDPLFGENVESRYRELRQHILAHAGDR